MRTASRFMIAAITAICFFGATATVASATPDSASRCLSACHVAGTEATIAASLVSTSTTTATYDVTMSGTAGSAWAVFDGSIRLTGATTTTGTIVVALGKTYSLFAVDGVAQSCATASVSPAAPAVETTVSLDETVPPVTTCDAVGPYVGAAAVTLTASDGAGRGVAYIYYSIDGAPVRLFRVGVLAQTTLNIPAPIIGTASHTIAFWSQDLAGNVEAHRSKAFTVAAPAVVKTATQLTLFISRESRLRGGTYTVYGDISPAFAGASIVIQARKPGSTTWLTQPVSPRATDARGHYSVSTHLHTVGVWTYRAVFAGDATHLESTSATHSIRILR